MRRSSRRRIAFETLSARRMLSVNAELFADINLGEGSSMTDSGGWVELDGIIYFPADDGEHGTELWLTDGTVEGTKMILDINDNLPTDPFSDAFSESSFPTQLTVYKNEVYFAATDSSGDELWKTDGTEAGTVKVKDIWEGEGSSFPQYLTVFKGELYFCAGAEDEGDELWKTDGTEDGTQLVVDINPGTESSFPIQLYVFNDELLFSAATDGDGPELFKTDGTEEGTVLVKNIHEDDFPSFPESFFEFKDELYFIAGDAVTPEGQLSSHLYKTDGTEDGTVRVTPERLTLNSSDRPNTTAFNDHLYFGGISDSNEYELYRTDGTPGETELVLDLSGAFNSFPSELTEYQGSLYFAANDETGRQLWRTNGEVGEQNTAERLTEVIRGNSGLFPTEFTKFNDELIFNGHNGTTFQIWHTDGTVVEAITNFTPNDTSGFFNLFAEFNDKLYFRGSGVDGLEMWTLTSNDATVAPPITELLDGDVDGNGKVEFADFLILSDNFGKEVSERGEGDLNGDNRVDFADFLLLSDDFGNSIAALFATDWDAT